MPYYSFWNIPLLVLWKKSNWSCGAIFCIMFPNSGSLCIMFFFQNILTDLHDELNLILSNSGVDHTWLSDIWLVFQCQLILYQSILGIRNLACTAQVLHLSFLVRIIVIRYMHWSVLTSCCYFHKSQSQFFLEPNDSGQEVGKREDMLKCKKKWCIFHYGKPFSPSFIILMLWEWYVHNWVVPKVWTKTSHHTEDQVI